MGTPSSCTVQWVISLINSQKITHLKVRNKKLGDGGQIQEHVLTILIYFLWPQGVLTVSSREITLTGYQDVPQSLSKMHDRTHISKCTDSL